MVDDESVASVGPFAQIVGRRIGDQAVKFVYKGREQFCVLFNINDDIAVRARVVAWRRVVVCEAVRTWMWMTFMTRGVGMRTRDDSGEEGAGRMGQGAWQWSRGG